MNKPARVAFEVIEHLDGQKILGRVIEVLDECEGVEIEVGDEISVVDLIDGELLAELPVGKCGSAMRDDCGEWLALAVIVPA